MANGIQDVIATELAAQYDRPIAVSVVNKVMRFPFLQELGFNGQLSFLSANFHGLVDFNDQMARYSLTSPQILQPAWNSIRQTAPLNPKVSALLFVSSTLGKVGNLFKLLIGFGQVFASSPDELQNPAATKAKTAAVLGS